MEILWKLKGIETPTPLTFLCVDKKKMTPNFNDQVSDVPKSKYAVTV